MIFTPFTGTDNHGGCITFAAGLLTKEDSDSYSWLLSKFLACMGTPPKMMITDQDPALRIAMENILSNTRHRFCMWHIMLKVPDKLPAGLRVNEEFNKKFYQNVWSIYNEPAVFEKNWNEIMTEFGLIGHKWLDTMYELRSFWIPAYFRDTQMGALFRTTSHSESENSFFSNFLDTNSNLVEFFIRFENAIDSQRNTHDQLSMTDETCFPELKTKLDLEYHAASVYTNKVFLDVQTEIEEAVDVCAILNIKIEGDLKIFEVDDYVNGVFYVTHNVSEDYISCICKYLNMKGLLCRHIFLIMKHKNLKKLSDKYIFKRWTKFACSIVGRDGPNCSSNAGDKISIGTNDLYFEACKCISMVDGNRELMAELLDVFKGASKIFASRVDVASASKCKEKMFEQYYGSSIPSEVTVLPPPVVKTKGSGSRLKSRREKAIKLANKPKRRCRKCNQMTNHDSRNCDKVVENLH